MCVPTLVHGRLPENVVHVLQLGLDAIEGGRAFGHDRISAVQPATVPLQTDTTSNAVQPAMRLFNKQCDYLREDRLRGRDTFIMHAQYKRVSAGPTAVMQGDPHVKAG